MSAVSLTRDDRFEQKKVLFVESSALTQGSPGHPSGMELGALVYTDFVTVFARKNWYSGEVRQEERPLPLSCTAGRGPCTKQLN